MPLILLILLLLATHAEMPTSSIKLQNPSFEGAPQDATVPQGWTACGMYSTPDILPGPWGVYQKASEGKTFVGLISREDNTWEYMGQTLSKPMKAKECYTFSIKLARSSGYVGYNRPLRLRIWGGMKKCGKDELLGQSKIVKHYDWRNYEFNFFPNKGYKFIILEAYYGGSTPYRGNLLMDNCSPIESCTRAGR